MRKLWVGLDAGETTTAYCVLDDAGYIVREGSCDTETALIVEQFSGFDQADGLTLAVEAGGATVHIRELRQLGFTVQVLEPLMVSKFLAAFAHKTDASDARGIAEIARRGGFAVKHVHVKSPECQHLRSELIVRSKLKQQKVALDAVIRSLFRLHAGCVVKATRGQSLRQAADEKVAWLKEHRGIDLSGEVVPVLDLLEGLKAFLRVADAKLNAKARSHPVCSRLMKIPGVGFVSALAFFSSIEDPHRFESASSVGAYLGLIPRLQESGGTKRRHGISKRGDRFTRASLFLGARSLFRAKSQDSAIRQWGLKLAKRTGPMRAQVAVARKLAVVMLAVWKSGGEYVPFPDGAGRC